MPFTAGDFEALIEWSESPQTLFHWAGKVFSFPLDRRQLERYLASRSASQDQCFTALDAETREPVGHVELSDLDLSNRSTYVVRVVVDPGRRGRGFGSAMMLAVVRKAFEELGLHRVEIRVFMSNPRTVAWLERLGFVREGILRDARLVGSEFHSYVVLSMLEDEWRVRHAEVATETSGALP